MAALIVLVIFIVQTIAEKRILLNDPSLLQSQVHVLERKVEDVLGKFTDLSVKYADLSTKYNDISTKNNDQSAKYNDLSTKYNDLSNKFTDLTTKYNDQSTKYNDLSTKYNTLLTKTNGLFLRVTLKKVPLHGIIHESSITILSFKLLNIVRFAGGSLYDHTGAAAEFVCLPLDPDLISGFTSGTAYVYGSEYDTNEFGHRSGNDLHCSVCRNKVQSSVLMIPGKSSCYDGWTMQYHGDLVAGANIHKAATQYICLDEHPDALTAGQDDHDGKLFYPVLAVCGSLACPPYEDGKYLVLSVPNKKTSTFLYTCSDVCQSDACLL